MSAEIYVCENCSKAVFPRRLLCPECGGSAFASTAVEQGTLEDFAELVDVKLGAVRVEQGPLLIVRLEGEPERGATVALDRDGSVPVVIA